MCERAANSARFRLGCALVLVAWSLGSCSTYDDALLAGYDPNLGGDAGASPDAGGRSGMAVDAGAPSVAGNTTSAGTGGTSFGGTGPVGDAGADAGAGMTSAGNPGMGGSGGSGGTVSTAGTGAVTGSAGGGTAGTGGGVSVSPYDMIDDFEDQDMRILISPPRNGPWYVFQDGTSGTESAFMFAAVTGTGAAPGSTQALHLTATGFASSSWGAGVGANFVAHGSGTPQVAYDVSAYSGIHFYAKVAAGKQTTVNVLIPTTYSDPDGTMCSDAVTDKHCSDHLFCQIAGLKTTWAAYQCDFAKLTQQGFGLKQASLDPKSVYSMQFTFKATTALPADIWIDDVSFVVKK